MNQKEMLTEMFTHLDDFQRAISDPPVVPKIDPVLIDLLRFTKDPEAPVFGIESARKVLGPHYHDNMHLIDVVKVMESLIARLSEHPEFKLNYRDCMRKVLMAPLEGVSTCLGDPVFGPTPATVTSVYAFYDAMVAEMLHILQMAPIGWCRDQLYPE